jgi:glycosyltransferase involved in cell wall biosynthesis
MRRTKVAFFSDVLIPGFDGAQRTMFHIIKRIPHERYEYTFICGEGPGEDFKYQVLDVPTISIPFNQDYSLAMPALAYFKIKKALDRFRPDVIHISSPSLLGKFALEYAVNRSIPVVTIYHTHFISYVDYYLNKVPIVTDIAKSRVISGQRSFYNRCDHVLVPTMEIKKELTSYGFKEEKLILWQRGIDHSVFNPEKRDTAFLRKLTGNDRYNILFASRLVWEKNLETLIRIYHEFEKRNDEVNFLIAGDGVARSALEARMPRALFLGKVDQETLARLYASSDTFLFPSISETYGSVVVEAMSCGCPCVIANGGGTKALIRQGITGFLCEPEAEQDYYEKIQMLRTHPTLRSLIIHEGIKYARNMDWQVLIDRYLKLIDQCARHSEFIV